MDRPQHADTVTCRDCTNWLGEMGASAALCSLHRMLVLDLAKCSDFETKKDEN